MKTHIDGDLGANLTSDQKEGLLLFSSWLTESVGDKPFVMSGFAGSGKTFLSMKFLQLVENKNLCWTVAAPTHKAVGVLKKALDEEGLRPTWYPSTIHRLLRLKLKRKGDIELCEETDQTLTSLNELALVIIDESSMIDQNLLEIVLRCAHSSGTRLVFVGDPEQLPPVGESHSSVFSMKRSTSVQLSQVVRHQGPILRLANCVRDGTIPCQIPPLIPPVKSSKSLVRILNKISWLDHAKSSLRSASENDNPDEARILCYTNRVLERLIPHARRAIHGDMADQMPVLPGEVLITRKAIMAAASASSDGQDEGEDPDMLISSNREMIVLDITPEDCDLKNFGLDNDDLFETSLVNTQIAKVKCGERELSLRLLPHMGTNSRQKLDFLLKRLSKIAKELGSKEGKKYWRKFFFIRDAFASVGPASVLTVHRSQGSTFENVFVASDVFWPQDLCLRKQLTYVAISRASNQVWLVGDSQNNASRSTWETQFKSYLS
ncbi:ATP-dependent DNA helicase [Prochlorococcus sp. MIT 1223]|uniref:ATP-dependent DNA helicase n=1 Tax=Prochlorococcus sp. MIT 1223 TaxID=3096217 RepID=UPI002A766BA3|nr:AAA family ATPase [Prochlorococcus sp. MIT 1223]